MWNLKGIWKWRSGERCHIRALWYQTFSALCTSHYKSARNVTLNLWKKAPHPRIGWQLWRRFFSQIYGRNFWWNVSRVQWLGFIISSKELLLSVFLHVWCKVRSCWCFCLVQIRHNHSFHVTDFSDNRDHPTGPKPVQTHRKVTLCQRRQFTFSMFCEG